MTTIDSLEIRGIRSYHPTISTQVRFSSPLTLLTGPTGSGKTAILEALRMAATGELPSNAAYGTAFIFDPVVNSKTKTEANIGLTFTDAQGVKRRVDRSFELTAFLTNSEWNRSFRRATRTLRLVGAANGPQVFGKDDELNVELSRLFRVSTPVLNSVVLVRQEDSLWPLGNPDTVKKHMDKILDSTRHARLLKEIRTCKAAKAVERDEAAVQVLRLAAKVDDLELLKSKAAAAEERRQQATSDFQVSSDELRALYAKHIVALDVKEKQAQLTKLIEEKGWLEKLREDKRKSIRHDLRQMSDCDLNSHIESLESSLASDRPGSELDRELASVRSELKKRNEEHRTLPLHERKNKLMKEIEKNDERLDHLETLKREFIVSEAFMNRVLPQETASIDAWTTCLEQCVADANEQKEALSKGGKKIVDDAQSDLNIAFLLMRSQKNRREEMKNQLKNKRSSTLEVKKSLEQAKLNFPSIETESNRVEERSAQLAQQQRKIVEMENNLTALEESQQELQNHQMEASQLQRASEDEETGWVRMNGLMNEFSNLICSSIDHLGRDADSRLQACARLLQEIFPVDVADERQVDTVENRKDLLLATYDTVQVRRKELMADARQRFRELDAAQQLVAGSLMEVREQRNSVEEELARAETSAREASQSLNGISTILDRDRMAELFPNSRGLATTFHVNREQHTFIGDTIKRVERKMQEANERITQHKTGGLHARRNLQGFNEDHQCSACGTRANNNNAARMRSFLEARVRYFRDRRNSSNVENQLKIELKELEKTREILSNVNRAISHALSKEPRLRKARTKLAQSEQKLASSKKKKEEAEASLNELTSRFRNGKGFGDAFSTREECEKVVQDWRTAQDRLHIAQSRLPVARTGNMESLGEISREIRDVREALKQERRSADKSSRALQKCMEMKKRRELHSSLSSAVAHISDQIEILDREIQSLEERHTSVAAELSKKRSAADADVEKARKLLSERRSALDKWKDSISGIEQWNRTEIRNAISGIDDSLKTLSAETESLGTQLKALEDEERQRNQLSNMQNNREFRDIEEKLLNKARDIERQKGLLAHLEEELDGTPVNVVKSRIDAKNSEKLEAAFRQKTLDEELEELRERINSLAHIVRECNEAKARRQLLELAMDDLNRYYHARYHALATFHTLRVKSINQTARELWHQAYRGTDIDDIELASKDLTIEPTGDLRRMFKYCVQMRQGQAKWDMRGRCSAGQEVLASLIIRLALAESFCEDCGILALDQPTANLDRDHVESLAVALRALIENRRRRGKFQLLLFTYDQEFLDILGAQDYCDDCYVIHKDRHGISSAQLKCFQELSI